MRVKPTTGEVEVDLNVDIESNNYDSKADANLQMKKQVSSLMVLLILVVHFYQI